jgi:regulator of RNase E activity RraA
MTRLAASRQVAATVVNGACRDTAVAVQLGYPIWSADRFMRTGKDRVRLAELGGTVTIDSVPVSPSDIVIGDDDGVVAVPARRCGEILDLARRIEAVEDAIVTDVQAGTRLKDARARHGYHTLQTRTVR